MVLSQNRGTPNGPQNIIVCILGPPKKASLILGNFHMDICGKCGPYVLRPLCSLLGSEERKTVVKEERKKQPGAQSRECLARTDPAP